MTADQVDADQVDADQVDADQVDVDERLAAPVLDVPTPGPAQRATSRSVLLLAYGTVLALLAWRVPGTYRRLRVELPPDVRAQIDDPRLEELALKTGVFLALLVTALAVAIFLALAVVLERRLFDGRLPVGHRHTVGLYSAVVVLCVVPPQVLGAALGRVDAQRSPLLYLWATGVGLLVPLLYRRQWRSLPNRSAALVVATSVGLAALTALG